MEPIDQRRMKSDRQSIRCFFKPKERNCSPANKPVFSFAAKKIGSRNTIRMTIGTCRIPFDNIHYTEFDRKINIIPINK